MTATVAGTGQLIGRCRCGEELRLGDAARGERYDIVLVHGLPHCEYFEETSAAQIMRDVGAKA